MAGWHQKSDTDIRTYNPKTILLKVEKRQGIPVRYESTTRSRTPCQQAVRVSIRRTFVSNSITMVEEERIIFDKFDDLLTRAAKKGKAFIRNYGDYTYQDILTAFANEAADALNHIDTVTIEHYKGITNALCTSLKIHEVNKEQVRSAFYIVANQYYTTSAKGKVNRVLKQQWYDARKTILLLGKLENKYSHINRIPSFLGARAHARLKTVKSIHAGRHNINTKFTRKKEQIAVRLNGNLNTFTNYQKSDSSGSIYKVFYGTNRKPTKEYDDIMSYTSKLDDSIHYGECEVFIPKEHNIGNQKRTLLESIYRYVTLNFKTDQLKLERFFVSSENSFYEEIKNLISQNDEDNNILIFIHGYNNSFESAAIKAAQLGYDLKIAGITAFFSWPSKNKLGRKNYNADESMLTACEKDITHFITSLYDKTNADKVHIIAHSMGNRALFRALQNMYHRGDVKFGQIILAAPDMNTKQFQKSPEIYKTISERTTLYQSDGDLALTASSFIHDDNRLGSSPPIVVEDGIDTIHVDQSTSKFLLELGHNYFSEAEALLGDIYTIIHDNRPPNKRLRLKMLTTQKKQQYWTLQP